MNKLMAKKLKKAKTSSRMLKMTHPAGNPGSICLCVFLFIHINETKMMKSRQVCQHTGQTWRLPSLIIGAGKVNRLKCSPPCGSL